MSFITSPGVIIPPLTAGAVAYGTGSQAKMNSAGTSGMFLQSAGAGVPVWASAGGVIRIARTSNTILTLANNGNLIAITSGTFTQTFTAAATLGSGWFVYLQNSGTGDITLDPNASELIDGLTSYVMYPGECRLVQCTGTAFTSVVLSPFSKVFAASGTFVTPPGYKNFGGLLWGGGGSGAKQSGSICSGGGGGACVPFTFTATQMGASQTITIASGGIGPSTDLTGTQGGNSTIGSLLTSFGGGGGNTNNEGVGGTGGGALSAGNTGGSNNTFIDGGAPSIFNSGSTLSGFENAIVDNQGFGGGASYNRSRPGNSTYGGGAGRGTSGYGGGNSVYGGGGGGPSASENTPAGLSSIGGNGGLGNTTSSGGDGATPAGGGGATRSGAKAGNGGNGQCTIFGVA